MKYLANMVSKSANYCGFDASNGNGLLLLCEAQLGDPFYERKSADFNAAKNCASAVRGISCAVANQTGVRLYERYWVFLILSFAKFTAASGLTKFVTLADYPVSSRV